MGFLSKLFGGGEAKGLAVEQMVRLIEERTGRACVRLVPEVGRPKPWESKIGGCPYLPKGFDYPFEESPVTAESKEKQPVGKAGTSGDAGPSSAGEAIRTERVPLRFLAQLNFAEMPPLEGFPAEGILQFYISGCEAYGLNFENPVEQKGFRVVFHERVVEDASALAPLPAPEQTGEETFPVSEELRLRFEASSMPMCGGDFRFDKLLLEVYNEAHPAAPVPSLANAPEEELNKVYDRLDARGHRVGGYPLFSQLDPREYHEDLRDHTVLLLQLDTDSTDAYSIAWGDSGVCNFFIRPSDLQRRDFSQVLYNWDCY